jgi:hypothetical protein
MARAQEVLAAAAGACYIAGEHGNFRGIDSTLAELAQASGPLAAAWTLALQTLRWSLEPRGTWEPAGPSPAAVRRFIEAGDEAGDEAGGEALQRIAARVCSVMERVCISTLDAAQLAAWTSLHARLESADGQPSVALRSAQLWQRLLEGATAGQDVVAKALFEEASRQKAPAQVIESTALRALLALSGGAREEAVELARRASRMAQSESLPQLEYLANLTLARVRRYSGRPHLALHILNALSRVAPPAWSGWIGWETLLAGGDRGDPDDDASRPGDAPAMAARTALAAFLRAARAGEWARFQTLAAALDSTVSAFWPDLAREAQVLIAALDPLRPLPSSSRAWFEGEEANLPCGLHGIGVSPGTGDENDDATVFVVARPGARGRRVLRPALAFATTPQLLARDAGKAAPGGVRTETGVAALALAGEDGMTREEFFQSVYGFPFVAHRHQAVLDVLCLRMRGLIGPAGRIRRDTGDGRPWLALSLGAPIIVADMRCALPIADRVLRALAKLGTISASSAATSLRMPLRTVQAVLQQLVAEGACSTERDGRRISYKVEDTTFTEVTAS